jgi:hypothetical protein
MTVYKPARRIEKGFNMRRVLEIFLARGFGSPNPL